jgi:hypothetical protein
MSIILSLAGDGISDDPLARQGYWQVARISGIRTTPQSADKPDLNASSPKSKSA